MLKRIGSLINVGKISGSTGVPPLLLAPEGTWGDNGDGTHSWAFGFPAQVVAGMFIKGEYSDDNFATIYESVSHELTAGDIAGTPFAFTTIAFVDGTYKARFWTTDEFEVVNSLVSDAIEFTVVNLLADTYITAGNGGEQTITSTVATYDFAVVTLGTADPGLRKMLALTFHTNGGTAAKHNSATIYPTDTDRTNGTNGIAMTEIAGTGASADTANTNYASLWNVNVQANTVSYVRLVCSAAPARATMHGWTHGRGASTDFIETAGNTGTIDVPSNGIALVHCGVTNATSTTSTATGFTEEWDQLASGALYTTGGTFTNDASAETGMTVTATWTASANVRLVASAYGDKVLF